MLISLHLFLFTSQQYCQYLLKPENLQLPSDTLAYHIDLGNLTVATTKTLDLPVTVPLFSSESTLISQDKNKL